MSVNKKLDPVDEDVIDKKSMSWKKIKTIFIAVTRILDLEERISKLEEYIPSDSPDACVNCHHIDNPITDMGMPYQQKDNSYIYHATRTCKRCGHSHLYEVPQLVKNPRTGKPNAI